LPHLVVGSLVAAASAALFACVDAGDDPAEPGEPVASEASHLFECGPL
jgi:hypothetical protein